MDELKDASANINIIPQTLTCYQRAFMLGCIACYSNF